MIIHQRIREFDIMKKGIFLLLVVLIAIDHTDTWKFDKSEDLAVIEFLDGCLLNLLEFIGPRLFGEKVPNRLISPRMRRVQRRIVMLHDFFRTKVVPPASNMLSMVSGIY